MIGNFLSALFAAIILIPFILMFLILVLFKRAGRAPIKVLGIAADLTTPFLLLSVYLIASTITGIETGVAYMMMTVAIFVTIVYTIYERMNVKEFRIGRLLRKTWRLFFLLLVFVYIILIIVGIVVRIVQYHQ